ncbi:MAG: SIMPL domain-containing protein, partial [Bdellovibrionales bacterium]
VNGQCEVEVAPDRAAITLVAQFTEKQSQLASKISAEIYEKLRAEIQKLNLKDLELQTTESFIQELFDYSVVSKRTSLGFQSSLGLRVSTSEINRLGEDIALSQKLQINRTENLSTFISAEKAK